MSGQPAKSYTLKSERLQVEVVTATFSVNVIDRKTGQKWTMTDEPFDEVIVERDGEVSKETLAGARKVTVHELGDHGILFEFADFRLQLLLILDENRLTFELIPREENERFRIRGMCYPRPFHVSRSPGAAVLAPFDQGIMIPGNWPEEINQFGDIWQFGDEERMRTAGEIFNMEVDWWSQLRPTYGPALESNTLMPWWGHVEEKGSVMMVLDEDCWTDSYLLVRHPAGGPTSYRPMWLPCRGRLNYPRRLVMHFGEGDYVSMSKDYRQIAAERGKLVTLREKQDRLPQLGKRVGAPMVAARFLKHSYQRFEHEVMMMFAEAADLMEAMQSKFGFEKAHLHCRGWQQHGHDIQYPDLVPPAPEAGGRVEFDRLASRVQALGYAFGLGGDNFHDVAMDSPLFEEETLLRFVNGKTNLRNMWASGLTSMICTSQALRYLRRNFEVGRTDYPSCKGLLETAHPDSYWIGNYVSSYECYDSRHPMTRNTCWDAQREIFQYINDKGLLLNNEHPKDWACPYFYAARTRQVSRPVYAVNDRQIGAVGRPTPLWSLVYNDCCIPSGDTELLKLMNGAPPAISVNFDGDARQVAWVKLHAKLQAAVMMDEMVSHEFLSDDNHLQRAEFSNGATVTIDEEKNTVKITGVEGIDETELEVCEISDGRRG